MKKFSTLVPVLALLGSMGAHASDPVVASDGGADDAVVVAVIDSAFNPYHFDFRAGLMPQATDADPGNDLPLDQPPHTWLPGFPDPASFASYGPLALTLPAAATARNGQLFTQDTAAWESVQSSSSQSLHYNWIPGTKVIGAMEFGSTRPFIYGNEEAHGTGTTSVSVGNIHGTCPECLLVFLSYESSGQAQAILDWAHAQPWIDVVSNSYGINQAEPINSNPQVARRNLTVRDQIYPGPVDAQRAASERGQTIMFSAGNGVENGFIVPHSTYTSSIKGPDWVVTVGAVQSVDPHPAYLGAGKPVDVAGVGDSYPSAYGSKTNGGSQNSFSGTSNASPTVAGTYARALYLARTDLAGPSRIQEDGVIARGAPYACGPARPSCELADGVLTAHELRLRLLHGAQRTLGGTTPAGLAAGPPVAEEVLLQQGHGTFLGKLKGNEAWVAEFERVMAPLEGRAVAPVRDPEEQNFMLVDSLCRQTIWGSWSGGYWTTSSTVPLPDPRYPVRSALTAACLAGA